MERERMMNLRTLSVLEGLAVVVLVVFAGGAFIVGDMLVTGIAVGDASLIAGAAFIASSFTAYAAWSETTYVVYDDETARRRTMVRRIAVISGVIAVTALLLTKTVF
jgi:hypothetical protein